MRPLRRRWPSPWHRGLTWSRQSPLRVVQRPAPAPSTRAEQCKIPDEWNSHLASEVYVMGGGKKNVGSISKLLEGAGQGDSKQANVSQRASDVACVVLRHGAMVVASCCCSSCCFSSCFCWVVALAKWKQCALLRFFFGYVLLLSLR